MDQVLAFIAVTLIVSVVGIFLIRIVERIIMNLRQWVNESPASEPQPPIQGRLLDASTTRRWMRFSAPDDSDES
jgi:hypothetical protein